MSGNGKEYLSADICARLAIDVLGFGGVLGEDGEAVLTERACALADDLLERSLYALGARFGDYAPDAVAPVSAPYRPEREDTDVLS